MNSQIYKFILKAIIERGNIGECHFRFHLCLLFQDKTTFKKVLYVEKLVNIFLSQNNYVSPFADY